MAYFRELVAVLLVGSMAAGTTAKVEFLQAKDADGTDSKAVTGAEATITANTNVTVAQVAFGTPADGDTITINGITFTKAAATDTAAREFADADGLVTCVNDATYGVSGVEASNNAGTITLQASDSGETVITATKTGSALTISTVEAVAFVNITASELDITNDFTHAAAKVTTTANTTVSVSMLRGVSRFMPEQKVAASTIL